MKWICNVCGYVHEGAEPPAECPVCHVGPENFEKVEEKKENSPNIKWVCTVCGYVHEGAEPPAECPICHVGPDKFEKMEEKKAEPKAEEKDETKKATEENDPNTKWVCSVCGYVYTGSEPPEKCPLCGVPKEKFSKKEEPKKADSEKKTSKPTGDGDKAEFADKHIVGVAKGVDSDILADLRANFEGECSEVGMYLAMSRVAHREGYPEIGLYWEKAAWEEAEHAAKFAELLGEVLTDSTEENLRMRVAAEVGACAGKKDLATRAKKLNLDAIHDTVHEMAKDEARHGAAFEGLLKRYFG